MGKRRKMARFLAGTCLVVGTAGAAHAEIRSLNLINTHTQERANVVFKRDGVYDQKGLQELNRLLRDWRRNEVTRMDPALFDLIWEVYRDTGAHQPINIVCGYRSPATNNMLRSRSRGVAKFSQHMLGKAMDFNLPDVNLSTLREVGMKKQVGGVGFYPSSSFVHMDTGSVRAWPRMTREQLVRLFPDGKTAHLPADGNPLPGYQQALAESEARKAHGGTSTASSSSSGGGLIAALFGGGSSSSSYSAAAGEDEEETAAPATKRSQELRQGPLPTKAAVGPSRDQTPPGVDAVPVYRSKPVQPQVRLAEVDVPPPAPARVAAAAPQPAPAAALPTTTARGSLVAMPIATPLPQPAPSREPIPSRFAAAGNNGLPPGWVQGPSGQAPAKSADAYASRELAAMATEAPRGTPIAVPLPMARPGAALVASAADVLHGTPFAVTLPKPRPGTQRLAAADGPVDPTRAFSALTGEQDEPQVALGYASAAASMPAAFATASLPAPARQPLAQQTAALGADPLRNAADIPSRFAAPPPATAAALARAAAQAGKADRIGDATARLVAGKSDRATEARLYDGTGSAFGKGFAQLRHPDQEGLAGLIDKPHSTLAVGFGRSDVAELQVQRFTGPAIVALAVLDTE